MAHSKIDNTFNGAMDKLTELSSVFRDGGKLEAACGDDCDLGDVRSAFEELMGAMREAHTEATMEEDVQEAGAPDYNPAKASAGGPGYASMPQQVKLAGDSIWDKEDTNPPMVTITDYEVVEEDGYVEVTVEHDGPWTIYTDSGFEKEISEMIGMEVGFSEQGMQEDGRAHLEGNDEDVTLERIKKLSGI